VRHVPDRPGGFAFGHLAGDSDVVEEMVAEIGQPVALTAKRESGTDAGDEAGAAARGGAGEKMFHRYSYCL
jgi:hypothetical protein